MKFGSITTGIVSDGLVFNMDAANRASYIPNATSSYNTIDLSISGSFISDPTYIAPPTSASCWQLDGVDDYINAGNPSALQITGDLSISGWVKTSSATQQKILFKDDNTNRCYSVGLKSGTLVVRFGVFNGGSFTSVSSTSTIHDGDWHHLMGVFSTSTSMKIYIDGVLEATNTTSIPSSIDNDPADFEIGRRGDGNYYWNGEIANTHIYNCALSANEVLHNYNALKSRFT